MFTVASLSIVRLSHYHWTRNLRIIGRYITTKHDKHKPRAWFFSDGLNRLWPTQNCRYFPDGIFKCIFSNENDWISIKISPKFVLKGPINNIPALVQIMAWRLSGDKPLFGPMIVNSLMHICATGPQWVICKSCHEQFNQHSFWISHNRYINSISRQFYIQKDINPIILRLWRQ